jgi:hypothetical protein
VQTAKALPTHGAELRALEYDIAEIIETLDFAAALGRAGVLVDEAPDAPAGVLELMAAATASLEDGDEDRVQIMSRSARALGQMGSALAPADALQAVGLVMGVVTSGSSPLHIREGVQALCGLVSNPMAVEPLVAQGGVEILLKLVADHQTDELMLCSCFSAMAQLARQVRVK